MGRRPVGSSSGLPRGKDLAVWTAGVRLSAKLICRDGLSRGYGELTPDIDCRAGIFCSPLAAVVDVAWSRGQGWGRKGPAPKGLGFGGGEGDVIVLQL